MKIGIGQMNSQADKSSNIIQAEKLIDQLASEGAQLVMLPENFHFMGPNEEKAKNAETMDGPIVEFFRKKAISHQIHIHSGSFTEKEGDKIFNTTIVVNPKGDIIAKYRKIHLFDVETPDGHVHRESDVITPGSEVVTFKINDITFGLSICYDLRFPEMFRKLSKNGAQIILLPAAFTLQTGRDHWELLLRARAVENLCWVCAAGQFGSAPPSSVCFGRSMIINPWGLVVAQAPDGISHIAADIDLKGMESIRANFPAMSHKREDLFPV